MATHRIAVQGTLRPDTDECAWFPYNVLATNDQWQYNVLCFGDIGDASQPSTGLIAYGTFSIPENYASGALFRIVWNTTKTTGNVVWDVDYRAVGGDDSESLDQTGTQEAVSVTDSAASAAHERLNVTVSVTDGNFTAGDTVQFLLRRDGADASDTLAGVAILHGLYFEYSD